MKVISCPLCRENNDIYIYIDENDVYIYDIENINTHTHSKNDKNMLHMYRKQEEYKINKL